MSGQLDALAPGWLSVLSALSESMRDEVALAHLIEGPNEARAVIDACQAQLRQGLTLRLMRGRDGWWFT